MYYLACRPKAAQSPAVYVLVKKDGVVQKFDTMNEADHAWSRFQFQYSELDYIIVKVEPEDDEEFHHPHLWR